MQTIQTYIRRHIYNLPTISYFLDQGPVVQSAVSLTSTLRVISLTVLANSMYNILIFFAEKMYCKSYSHFFSKKFQHICVSLDVNFNESLLTTSLVLNNWAQTCLSQQWRPRLNATYPDNMIPARFSFVGVFVALVYHLFSNLFIFTTTGASAVGTCDSSLRTSV